MQFATVMSLQPRDLLMTFMLYYLSNSLVTCKKVHGKYDSPVDDTDDQQMDYYRFLYQRLKEDAARHLSKRRHNVVPTFYSIPGNLTLASIFLAVLFNPATNHFCHLL